MASRGRVLAAGTAYNASALSFVLHANSPFLPTLRGDVRIFATHAGAWGGGGCDLTVFYVHGDNFQKFHRHWQRVCSTHGDQLYPTLKQQCDDYFYIPSRREYRGVGGIFYDDAGLQGSSLYEFQKDVLQNFLPSYMHIIEQARHLDWSPAQKRWQRIRRGRYIEFNLLNDRGVKFGLAGSPASRTDSIMISAPPSVEWPYRFVPEPASPEQLTLDLLSGPPVDWAHVNLDDV